MSTLTITAKGQVTLRRELLRHLGVGPGGKVDVALLPGGRIQVSAVKPKGKISDFFGMLEREGQRTLSIEEMNEIIEQGWAGELREDDA